MGLACPGGGDEVGSCWLPAPKENVPKDSNRKENTRFERMKQVWRRGKGRSIFTGRFLMDISQVVQFFGKKSLSCSLLDTIKPVTVLIFT
jgi:hypothetical protein